MKIATVSMKSDPKLWRRSKEAACRKAGLCKHSARKMQWAVRYYKKKGGKFASPRSAENHLRVWTQQRWRTASGKKSGGKRRYLPDEAWRHLTKDQVRRTNAAKLSGYKKGKQWVRQPKDVARVASKYR